MDKFILNSDSVRANCIAFLSQIPSDGSKEVTINDVKEKRSQGQRRLQWMWYTDIAKEQGYQPEFIRDYYMRKFAVRIFYRDDINGSADTLDAIRDLKARGMNEHYEALIHGFVKNISSNSFSVKQNKEYLDLVYHDAIEKGLVLKVPEDLKYAHETT